MPPVYVVCPSGFVTGGTELLHQLVHALRENNVPSFVVYTPFDQSHDVPAAFRRYNIQSARRQEIEAGSRVVIPEHLPLLTSQFPACDIYFWWMSVDNLVTSVRPILRRLMGQHIEASRLKVVRRFSSLHLYQSEYARIYLTKHNLTPNCRLSDYLADEYLNPLPSLLDAPRDEIVVYNPKKGLAQSLAVMREVGRRKNRNVEFVAIQNMDRTEVRALLSRAKVYIDFGNHPGKDRIPREAVALGACLLTNRKGSAQNSIDVPIPEEYKLDDSDKLFASKAADHVERILADFSSASKKFDAYRDIITSEKEVFLSDVKKIFVPEV